MQVRHRADQVGHLQGEAPDLGHDFLHITDLETVGGFEVPGEDRIQEPQPLVAVPSSRGGPRRDQLVGDAGHRRGHDDQTALRRRVADDAGDRGNAAGIRHARPAELVDLDPMTLAHAPPNFNGTS